MSKPKFIFLGGHERALLEAIRASSLPMGSVIIKPNNDIDKNELKYKKWLNNDILLGCIKYCGSNQDIMKQNGIDTFFELENQYKLIQEKKCKFSRVIRDKIEFVYNKITTK